MFLSIQADTDKQLEVWNCVVWCGVCVVFGYYCVCVLLYVFNNLIQNNLACGCTAGLGYMYVPVLCVYMYSAQGGHM